jgi:hypothetical protein
VEPGDGRTTPHRRWPWPGLELGKASPLAGSRGGGSDRPSQADAVARRREAACEGVGVGVATRARLVRRRLREWIGVTGQESGWAVDLGFLW